MGLRKLWGQVMLSAPSQDGDLGGFSPLSDGWNKAGKMGFLSNELGGEEETTPLAGWRRELAGGGGKRGLFFKVHPVPGVLQEIKAFGGLGREPKSVFICTQI